MGNGLARSVVRYKVKLQCRRSKMVRFMCYPRTTTNAGGTGLWPSRIPVPSGSMFGRQEGESNLE